MKYLKPHLTFFVLTMLTFVFGWFNYAVLTNSALDINIRDTYFIISHYNIYKLIGSIFVLVGITYWVYDKTAIEINKLFINLHIQTSMVCFFIYILGLLHFKYINSNRFPLFDGSSNENLTLTIVFSLFILIQVLFVLNIIFSTIKHFISKTKS